MKKIEGKAFLGVYIPEKLFIELKKRAIEERQTMTRAVTGLIEKYLAR